MTIDSTAAPDDRAHRMSLDQWWCACGTANRSFRRTCRYCGVVEPLEAARAALGVFLEPFPTSVSIVTKGTTRVVPAEEPVFLIRGQDAVSGDAVRAWADLAETAGSDATIVNTAREHAAKMDAWPKKKIADLPTERNR